MKRLENVNRTIFTLIIFLLFSLNVNGQGWKKEFDIVQLDASVGVLQTLDDGFLIAGKPRMFTVDSAWLQLVRTDASGNEIWNKSYDADIEFYGNNQMIALEDSTFVIVGTTSDFSDLVLLKVDDAGDVVWSRQFDDKGVDNPGFSVGQTADGGFIMSSATISPVCNCRRILLVKTDDAGVLEWKQELATVNGSFDAHSLVVLPNGEIVVTGSIFNSNGVNIFLVKTDAQGQLLWEKEWITPILEFGVSVLHTTGGDLLLLARQENEGDIRLIKLDTNGNELWNKIHEPFRECIPNDLIETPDQGYVITGSQEQIQAIPIGDAFLLKTDIDGEELWAKKYDFHGTPEVAIAVVNTSDGGFAFTGRIRPSASEYEMYLAKTDSLGSVYSNYIQGNVFDDEDENCLLDTGEEGLEGWVVKAEKENEAFFAISDSLGNYSILADSGAYEIIIEPYAYWVPCQSSYPVSFPDFYTNVDLDLPLQATADCPYMEVNIGNPFLRACAENYYNVQYCNYGTTAAIGSTVEVTLDSSMAYINATAPLLSQAGQVFTFDVGDLDVGECGDFRITFDLSCDSLLLGQTLCASARIFPDSICGSGLWNGPNIEVVGNCTMNDDSVTFRIQNVGTSMFNTFDYIVIEDNIILFQNPFQLAFGETMDVSFPAATNSSYHMLAGQGLGFPVTLGNPIATASVDACMGMSSPGAYSQIPEDDGEPYYSEYCTPVVSSFDPNDKRTFPSGWTTDHFIDQNTDLEYHIRFQNTGTDTAFLVVLLDTIDTELLKVESIRLGAASHPFTFDVLNNGTLQFTFRNIKLPHEDIDEPGSHGFVSFKIEQQADNPFGSVIKNNAAIYFDFNAPVITNETFHTIKDPWIELIDVQTTDIANRLPIKVYPNPFQTSATIELPDDIVREGVFVLYNMQGQVVRKILFSGSQFQLEREELVGGMYGYQIRIDGQVVNAGKMIVGNK